MSSKTFRRLAAEHSSLHVGDPPPNYLFPRNFDSLPDDLTQLDIFLAGPQGTAYADGLWKLHLDIPRDYPTTPPRAFFRTKIWHPNVEEATGSICVDTLKRDWESKLTLRHVLLTISCLLIYPNPASALNAEAGALLQEDFDTFSKRARLMTKIHATVPRDLEEAVKEAKSRGEDRKSSPSLILRRFDTGQSAKLFPSSVKTEGLGIQGFSLPDFIDNDESKENGEFSHSASSHTPPFTVTVRRRGPAIPLGELDISHDMDMRTTDIDANDAETEKPFSSQQNVANNISNESKLDSDLSIPEDSIFTQSQPLFSRSRPHLPRSPASYLASDHTTNSRHAFNSSSRSTGLTPHLSSWGGVSKPRATSSPKAPQKAIVVKGASKRRWDGRPMDQEAKKRKALEAKMWELVGGDVRKYNRGDFFPKKTSFDRL